MPISSLTHALEADLIAKLTEAMAPIGVAVEAFPANPVDFEVAPYRSQIFFSLQSRSFDPPEVIDTVRRDFSQRFVIDWGLQAEFVNLSNHAGVYQVLDRCWLALSGYCPRYTGELADLNRIVTFEPMFLRNEAFSSLDNAIYTYNQTWSQPVMVYSDIGRLHAEFSLDEIRIGLHRAKAGDLEDEVLDQTMEYPVPES